MDPPDGSAGVADDTGAEVGCTTVEGHTPVVVVMQTSAPVLQVGSVVSHLEEAGNDVHRSAGADRTILGVVPIGAVQGDLCPPQFDRLMAELRIIAPALGRTICLDPVVRRGWGAG